MHPLRWLTAMMLLACAPTPGEVVPESTAAVSSDRWAPLEDSRSVCAWRGGLFAPEDFAAVPAPNESDRACINMAECSWRVEVIDEPTISIVAGKRSEARPFEPVEPGPWTRFGGAVYMLQVPDGWLVAWNAGEWGGRVSWYSADGATERVLSEAHVVGLFDRKDAILAPGADNLPLQASAGLVLHIARNELGEWQATPGPQPLRDAAVAGFLEDDTLWIATPTTVEAVARSGAVTLVAKVSWGLPAPLHPTSIVRTADGTLLVGMRHGVARLRPTTDGGHVEDWLVPPPCRELSYQHDRGCLCAGLIQ